MKKGIPIESLGVVFKLGGAGSGPNLPVTIDDFMTFLPNHQYVFMPTGALWLASGVNARLPKVPIYDSDGKQKVDGKGKPMFLTATAWLDQNRRVEQMTWVPGHPRVITNRLVDEGGWIDKKDATLFNLYRAPLVGLGDANCAMPWREHVRRIYPLDAEHIERWLAHRVQRPGEKVNHALMLGGAQGIGKDTLLAPVSNAVGAWNFIDISPVQMLGRFNGFAKSVILRINEARDLGEVDRFKFYEHTKGYITSPPETIRVDEKHLREYHIFNVCGVIITTNYKTDGIYLPADDRRHYVAWSACVKEEFEDSYWEALWHWYRKRDGFAHVAAYLNELDLEGFDAKAPPPKTAAFFDIITSNIAPEDIEMSDVLEEMGKPDAVTLDTMIEHATKCPVPRNLDWLLDKRHRRAMPHRMERCGYAAVRNPGRKQGDWRVSGKRQVVYARADLTPSEQLSAARKLAAEKGPSGSDGSDPENVPGGSGGSHSEAQGQ